MNNLQIILMIAVPLYTLFAICFGVWLGHKLTLKAFAHVQPSMKDMAKQMEGTVTTEPDWVDEAYKEPIPDVDEDAMETLRKEFEKTGLPEEVWNSYAKSGRHPQEFFGYDIDYAHQGVEEELDKESIQ